MESFGRQPIKDIDFECVGVKSEDIWAVGSIAPSAALRWNGSSWNRVATISTVSSQLVVWGTSTDDAWIGAIQGKILHWNGTSWSDSPSNVSWNIFAGFSFSKDTAWAGGSYGAILRWDGKIWREVRGIQSSNPINQEIWSIWGSTEDEVWAVGQNGVFLRWNGTEWKLLQYKLGDGLTGVWGSSADDVWAVGRNGMILRFTP